MLTASGASNPTTAYICKSLASLYPETRNVEERLIYVRELSANVKRKVENFSKNRNGRIQGIETKLSRLEMCVSTSTSEQENLKQEIALLEEALRAIQKDMKMISENQKGKSFEPENSASDDTTERRARAQQVKLGLADQAKKDDGQKNGESQTHEAATADGVKIQFLCDGKLILHKIV